jgi:hypothetical protein
MCAGYRPMMLLGMILDVCLPVSGLRQAEKAGLNTN